MQNHYPIVMGDNKWYSNGLTAEEAAKLEHRYGKIGLAQYGLTDYQKLALTLGISYDNGASTGWYLTNPEDIKNLLIETDCRIISQLEGKVIEAYVTNGILQGISVNKNLI